MNILAIDTTTKIASVSIKYNDNILNNKIDNEITHSEKLLPLIDKSLNKLNISLKDIELLSCINGPGSFTGIRIGLATIKAISQVKKLNIFAISSLELLATTTYMKSRLYSKGKTSIVASIIDAKNDRVYYSLYKLSTDNIKIKCEKLVDINNEKIDIVLKNIAKYITDNNLSNIIYCGNCITKFEENILETSKNINIANYSLYDLYPTTDDLINTIENISNYDNYIFNAFTLNATYARLSQAERIKNEQNNK